MGTDKVGSSCEESADWFAIRTTCWRRAGERLSNCLNPTPQTTRVCNLVSHKAMETKTLLNEFLVTNHCTLHVPSILLDIFHCSFLNDQSGGKREMFQRHHYIVTNLRKARHMSAFAASEWSFELTRTRSLSSSDMVQLQLPEIQTNSCKSEAKSWNGVTNKKLIECTFL